MRPASLTVITAPASEPLTTAEAKLQARVETDADDALVSMWITAARTVAETETQRALISQTKEAKYTAWPSAGLGIWLPCPPLISVTSVKYYDTDGTEQTLSTSVYEVDTASEPGQVVLKPGQSWPALQSDKHNPIAIRYVAGYADAASVPKLIKAGMYLIIGHLYDQRKDSVERALSKIPMGASDCFGLCAAPWGF